MRFSIVTCTYNRAQYLPSTLLSLCKQDYSTNDYELVVIDNNSTDNTAEVCNDFIRQYPDTTIRYFKETNQGLSYALNRGISEAHGEFIAYIDDDETVEKNYLTVLDGYLRQNPKIEYMASIITPIYEGGEPRWMSPFTQRLIGGYFNEGNQVKLMSNGKYPGTGHTIIKRELYQRFGTYNTKLGRKGTGLMGAEDKDMAHRLMSGGIACYYLPIPVYHHIPAYKLTDEFFAKLTYSIGKSERLRTKNTSNQAYRKRIISELVKWMASLVLCFFYCITFRPSKGFKLLSFRWNVSKGLLGK